LSRVGEVLPGAATADAFSGVTTRGITAIGARLEDGGDVSADVAPVVRHDSSFDLLVGRSAVHERDPAVLKPSDGVGAVGHVGGGDDDEAEWGAGWRLGVEVGFVSVQQGASALVVRSRGGGGGVRDVSRETLRCRSEGSFMITSR
jgi:hypothetical protein